MITDNITGKQLGVYITSYILFAIVFIYMFRIPHRITGKPDIVNEYYYINWKVSIVADLVFITLYGLVALAVWQNFNVTNVYSQLAILCVTTGLLTMFFCWAFTRNPVSSSFFSRWFHTVGNSAAVYDIIVLGTIFILYKVLIQYV